MIPVVALQMIPVIFGKMLSRTLSGGFAPPAAWQTTAVFFMVLSAARKRYCFMCYKRYCLRAMIIIYSMQPSETRDKINFSPKESLFDVIHDAIYIEAPLEDNDLDDYDQ